MNYPATNRCAFIPVVAPQGEGVEGEERIGGSPLALMLVGFGREAVQVAAGRQTLPAGNEDVTEGADVAAIGTSAERTAA